LQERSVDQVAFFVEQSVVSGTGQPESLRIGTEEAGESDPAARIGGFVGGRLHDQAWAS
jgi:hypothetical protein